MNQDDSPRAVAERLRKQFAETGQYDPIDLVKLLGDPRHVVSVQSNPMGGARVVLSPERIKRG